MKFNNNWGVLFFSLLLWTNLHAQTALKFTKPVTIENIQPREITITWETNIPANTTIFYNELGECQMTTVSGKVAKTRRMTLRDLKPATFYKVQVCNHTAESEICEEPKIYTTASLSTGEMKVYFNHSVNSSFSNGATPDGTTPGEAQTAIVALIDNAQTSIDFCMFDMSRPLIIDALKAAHNRGVVVRYVTDAETDNVGLNITPPFPVLRGNVGSHFMHNKFMVIDANSVDQSYVLTGSMNFTYNGVLENANNFVVIQDQALANAYTLEFEEMWGSTGSQPNENNAKFGEEKTDNTPHIFNIDGKTVESYFSPSDHTTDHIEAALLSAGHDVEFALFAFTMWQLRDAVIANKDNGASVRGIIEKADDSSTVYFNLLNHGVNVMNHPLDMLLHHKYGIVDSASPASDPLVITGSHNWSYSAETYNDENTLIIHDPDIANIYLQEFEARWGELVDVAEIVTNSQQVRVLPNPVYDHFEISYDGQSAIKGNLQLIDYSGRQIKSFGHYRLTENEIIPLSVSGVPSGEYFLLLANVNGVVFIKKIVII